MFRYKSTSQCWLINGPYTFSNGAPVGAHGVGWGPSRPIPCHSIPYSIPTLKPGEMINREAAI